METRHLPSESAVIGRPDLVLNTAFLLLNTWAAWCGEPHFVTCLIKGSHHCPPGGRVPKCRQWAGAQEELAKSAKLGLLTPLSDLHVCTFQFANLTP